MSKLQISDIKDSREYERIRDDFRKEIIELKKSRRIFLGDILTMLFENKKTVEFQVNEMARVEKLISDEQIQQELDVYNQLLPQQNQLSATLFLELTSKEQLKEWLPKMIDIQNQIFFVFGNEAVGSYEPGEERLTREDEITSSVHYVKFDFSDEQVQKFLSQDEIILESRHKDYKQKVIIDGKTLQEMKKDLGK